MAGGETELRAALTRARETIEEQQAMIARLTSTPLIYAPIVSTSQGSLVVAADGGLVEVARPDGAYHAGEIVKLSMETMQVADHAKFSPVGEVGVVSRAIDDGLSEVDYQGASRVVYHAGVEAPDRGDRVVLDSSGAVILRNLGRSDERFTFASASNVTWESIGGLVDAKQEMVDAIETPRRYAELYTYYGKAPVKGVMLYGPPGCGKTMLGKAAAASLASEAGRDGFMYVKGPEILDKYVGVAEGTIRQIFERAKLHERESGFPAVVFIDEADAILGRRGSGISSDIERTIVPMFLAEMDGLEASGALIILSTNRPDVLDPAVVRDGRIDRKIRVSRPTVEDAASIASIYFDRVPATAGVTTDELAETAAVELFSPHRVLRDVSMRDGSWVSITLGSAVSGGMIAGVVDKATSLALRRDLAAGRVRVGRGITSDDVAAAVASVYAQAADLDHADVIEEVVGSFDNIATIKKPRERNGNGGSV